MVIYHATWKFNNCAFTAVYHAIRMSKKCASIVVESDLGLQYGASYFLLPRQRIMVGIHDQRGRNHASLRHQEAKPRFAAARTEVKIAASLHTSPHLSHSPTPPTAVNGIQTLGTAQATGNGTMPLGTEGIRLVRRGTTRTERGQPGGRQTRDTTRSHQGTARCHLDRQANSYYYTGPPGTARCHLLGLPLARHLGQSSTQRRPPPGCNVHRPG